MMLRTHNSSPIGRLRDHQQKQTLALQGFVNGGAYATKYEPLNDTALRVCGEDNVVILTSYSHNPLNLAMS